MLSLRKPENLKYPLSKSVERSPIMFLNFLKALAGNKKITILIE